MTGRRGSLDETCAAPRPRSRGPRPGPGGDGGGDVRAEQAAPALGLAFEIRSAHSVLDLPTLDEQRALYVRLQVQWEEVEREPGVFDWAPHASVVESIRGAGYRVVLGLTGSHPHHVPGGGPPSPLAGESVAAWLAFVRSAVREFGGQVEVLEIWSGGYEPASGATQLFDPETYAFLLKSSALAAHAEASALDAELRLAQAPVPPDALDWQRALWEEDSAAYIDILPLILDASGEGEDAREQIARFARENLIHPPAAELWAHPGSGNESAGWGGVGAALRAAAGGVAVALVAPNGVAGQRRDQAAWVAAADRLLSAGYAPAPPGRVSFLDEDGAELAGGKVLGRFFSDSDFSTLLFYELPGPEDELPRQRMIVDSLFVRNPRLLDPLTGRELRVSSSPAEGGAPGRAIRVAASRHPLVLMFEKPAASEGFELPPEEIETTGSRELTAEEIIARHQEVREIENDSLERWMARARIEFHFKFALGGPTIDVAVDSNYFWERGGDAGVGANGLLHQRQQGHLEEHPSAALHPAGDGRRAAPGSHAGQDLRLSADRARRREGTRGLRAGIPPRRRRLGGEPLPRARLDRPPEFRAAQDPVHSDQHGPAGTVQRGAESLPRGDRCGGKPVLAPGRSFFAI